VSQINVPLIFNTFPGFKPIDFKDYPSEGFAILRLEGRPERMRCCFRCGLELGELKKTYWLRLQHLRIMGLQLEVHLERECRYCEGCKKTRAEHLSFECEDSPHVTEDLAWYISRLTEMTAVMAVSRLESIDKNLCYRIDKRILRRLLQGYKIPKVTRISVDEVYTRGPKQLKEGETRDDLFLTVIVDSTTRKVIWVSKSRRKEALDEFFKLIGPEACKRIEVVACDQHEGYSASVKEFCPRATIVWDRFHLVQNFNAALNEDRKEELIRQGISFEEQKLLQGRNRFIFMKRAYERTEKEKKMIDEIASLNHKILQMEIIKERFHQVFDCTNEDDAAVIMAEIYQWSWDCGAKNVWKWIADIRFEQRFLNYFLHPVTTSVSEGFNHVIKNLKRQGCGYRDMIYFALKILQKAGYLNSRYAFPKGIHFMQTEEKVRHGAPKLGSKRLRSTKYRNHSNNQFQEK